MARGADGVVRLFSLEIGSGCYANEGDRVSAVCRFVERNAGAGPG